MTRKSEIVDIAAIVRHQTERAVLVDHGGRELAWLPLAQIEIAPNEDGGSSTITMPRWLAEEKGIV